MMELTTGVETEQPTQAPVENNNNPKKRKRKKTSTVISSRERAPRPVVRAARIKYRRGKKKQP